MKNPQKSLHFADCVSKSNIHNEKPSRNRDFVCIAKIKNNMQLTGIPVRYTLNILG